LVHFSVSPTQIFGSIWKVLSLGGGLAMVSYVVSNMQGVGPPRFKGVITLLLLLWNWMTRMVYIPKDETVELSKHVTREKGKARASTNR
jgi:hypothetical protein